MIPGTPRSAIITQTRQDQIAVEVHKIQDVLLVEPQEYFGVSSMVINVGFVTTTSYHGPQPYEPPEEWQEDILHVLHTWMPEDYLFIRSGNPRMLSDAITLEFLDSLKSMNVDVYESDGGLHCQRM